MKEFYVILEGTWDCSSLIEANSREEAIDIAINYVDSGGYRPDIYHTEQWLDSEEDNRKKEIKILDLESGTFFNSHHAWQ